MLRLQIQKLTEEKGTYLKTNLLGLQHVYSLKLYLVIRNEQPSSQIHEISESELKNKFFPLEHMNEISIIFSGITLTSFIH